MRPNNKVVNYTDEELRTKIAEFCGWNVHHGGNYVSINNPGVSELIGLVDPLTSKDVMHEVLGFLFDETHGGNEHPFVNYLFYKMVEDNPGSELHEINVWMAEARQLAIAFVKTIDSQK